MDKTNVFDIYLTMGSFSIPDLDDLIQRFPHIADTEVQDRMNENIQRGSRFLELDLPENVALDLLHRLKSGKAVGYVVDSAYRHPRISQEYAAAIAEKELNRMVAQGSPDKSYGPMHFHGGDATTWSFLRGILNLPWPRPIPGALFVYVDKLDGHIWQREEFKHLNRR